MCLGFLLNCRVCETIDQVAEALSVERRHLANLQPIPKKLPALLAQWVRFSHGAFMPAIPAS